MVTTLARESCPHPVSRFPSAPLPFKGSVTASAATDGTAGPTVNRTLIRLAAAGEFRPRHDRIVPSRYFLFDLRSGDSCTLISPVHDTANECCVNDTAVLVQNGGASFRCGLSCQPLFRGAIRRIHSLKKCHPSWDGYNSLTLSLARGSFASLDGNEETPAQVRSAAGRIC